VVKSSKDAALEKCADDVAGIIDAHLAKLPLAEQERRLQAFERVVARVSGRAGTRGSGAAPHHAPAYPVHARGRR
jgi:hypothetical protein